MDAIEKFLSPTQAAKKIGVSRQRIDQWLREGRLPYRTIFGVRRIAPADCRRPKRLKSGQKPV